MTIVDDREKVERQQEHRAPDQEEPGLPSGERPRRTCPQPGDEDAAGDGVKPDESDFTETLVERGRRHTQDSARGKRQRQEDEAADQDGAADLRCYEAGKNEAEE